MITQNLKHVALASLLGMDSKECCLQWGNDPCYVVAN